MKRQLDEKEKKLQHSKAPKMISSLKKHFGSKEDDKEDDQDAKGKMPKEDRKKVATMVLKKKMMKR